MQNTDVWILDLFWVFDWLEQKILGEVFLKYSIFQHNRCGKKNVIADFAPSWLEGCLTKFLIDIFGA